MATIGTEYPTLVDVAKRKDPDGKVGMIAEVMNEVNPILDDMPFIEGNLPTGHQGIIRTGLPTVAWRMLNYGVPASKSSTKQVVDTCGMLEVYSVIDKKLYELNGARDAFRMSEDKAFIQAMSLELADALFYANTDVDPEKFLGLSPRYSDLSAENGGQVIDATGAGSDNTSIWLISWGEQTVHGIYPQGSSAGLKHENLGEKTEVQVDTATGNTVRRYQALVSHFTQDVGLHLRDWAAITRIANISAAAYDGSTAAKNPFDASYTGPDFVNLMLDAVYKIPLRLRNVGRLVFYCNPAVKAALDKIAMAKTSAQLRIETFENGKRMTYFQGIPIHECDAILHDEDPVT